MKKDILVVKFGGSVLRDSKAMERAASWVKGLLEQYGVVAVISAMKGQTDDLLRLAKDVNPDINPMLLDEILAMGERTSARLFTAALMRYGIDAVLVDPSNDYWPVVTNDRYNDADPIYSETEKRCMEKLLPLIQAGKVPVVCGYIGVTQDGKITTMGRGGSDTTAILLGSCLRAKEVILVKDVEGIFTGDPSKVKNAKKLDVLTADEARLLMEGGSKVIHAKALRYLKNGVRLRISSMDDLEGSGTIIIGTMPSLDVSVQPDKITMVTMVAGKSDGISMAAPVIELIQKNGGKVISLVTEERSLIVYANINRELVDKLHEETIKSGIAKALSFFEGLALIKVCGTMLETTPGIVQKIVAPLASSYINIYGVITISSSVRIFVSEKDVERAASLIRSNLEMVMDERD